MVANLQKALVLKESPLVRPRVTRSATLSPTPQKLLRVITKLVLKIASPLRITNATFLLVALSSCGKNEKEYSSIDEWVGCYESSRFSESQLVISKTEMIWGGRVIYDEVTYYDGGLRPPVFYVSPAFEPKSKGKDLIFELHPSLKKLTIQTAPISGRNAIELTTVNDAQNAYFLKRPCT